MRQFALRLKAWSLMVGVAIVAVCCAAKVHVESAPGYAIALIASSTAFLAHNTYADALGQRRARGLATSRPQNAALLLASSMIALLVIGLSDMAFIAGYYGFLKVVSEVVVESHWTSYYDPVYMVTGVVIGVILALGVASSLRRTIWPFERVVQTRPHWWLALWPVVVAALVALALGLEELRERWEFCTMMAHYHTGPLARADGPEKAAFHAWLKRWYEEAALRPWRPIHPDQLPPGL
jgi:hypothetical protein